MYKSVKELASKLHAAAYAVFAEFPGVNPKDMEELTSQIFRIATLLHRDHTKNQREIKGIWDKVAAKINSPAKAKQLALPISMLLWRNGLASIDDVEKLLVPIPEDEKSLLQNIDNAHLEAATAVLPDHPSQISTDCIERLTTQLNKNFPDELRRAKSRACDVKTSLSVLVKIIAPAAAFGAGLTAGSIPGKLGYTHPVLELVGVALGTLTFGSIYMGAEVELVSFKHWKIGLVSVLCIAAALCCSIPSAVLNHDGVAGNIGNSPINLNNTAISDPVALGCGVANYGANVILGQGQLMQVWILLSLWREHFNHMPSTWQKGIFIFRKVAAFGICAISMYCYFQSGRKIPSIDNTYGSYIVSFLENVTDFSTILLASSRLPWGGVLSSPLPWYSKLYNAMTGFSIGAIIAKYTYDTITEEGGFFDTENVLIFMLAVTFTLNQHYYYPFGRYVQWLMHDIIWGKMIRGVGNAIYWTGQKAYSCIPSAPPAGYLPLPTDPPRDSDV